MSQARARLEAALRSRNPDELGAAIQAPIKGGTDLAQGRDVARLSLLSPSLQTAVGLCLRGTP